VPTSPFPRLHGRDQPSVGTARVVTHFVDLWSIMKSFLIPGIADTNNINNNTVSRYNRNSLLLCSSMDAGTTHP
jgi:hypothetical protein